MSNISSIWTLGNVSFRVIEYDENIKLLTDIVKPVGEYNQFLQQEIESGSLSLKVHTDNPSSVVREFLSNDVLELKRHDGFIQFVQPITEDFKLEPPTKGSKILDLEFNCADPYKYSQTLNSTTATLNLTDNTFYFYYNGDFDTPLEFRLNNYSYADVSKDFAVTNETLEVRSTITYNTGENISLWKLTSIPDGDWFDTNGLELPAFDNISGWVWSDVDVGTILDKKGDDYILAIQYPSRGSDWDYNTNYFKFSMPNHSAHKYLKFYMGSYLYYEGKQSFASKTLYIWNNNQSKWEHLLDCGRLEQWFTCDFESTPLENYDISDRIFFLVGTRTKAKKSEKLRGSKIYLWAVKYTEINDYDLVSVMDLREYDPHLYIDLVIEGTNTFTGQAKLTVHPASSRNNFDSKVVLSSKTIDGTNWNTTHAITVLRGSYDTIACKLSIESKTESGIVKIFNTSSSKSGLLWYVYHPDGYENKSIGENYLTFIKSMEYGKTVNNIKVRNILDLTTEQRFDNPLLGEFYCFNNSHFYTFNPFENLDSCYIEKNNNVGVYDNQLWFGSGGEIIYGIYSPLAFNQIPEGRYQGIGTLQTYINTNNSDSGWNEVQLYNSSWYMPLYNEDCKLRGENHFFVKLTCNTSANISGFDIRCPLVSGGNDFVYLKPNTTNIINITATNINESMEIYLRYKNAYI